MPATAGRIRMPANNRLSVSDSLRTSEIWQKSIKYDPYAPSGSPEEGEAAGGPETHGRKAVGTLSALARLTGNTGLTTPGVCRTCGEVGHLTYQCRNAIPPLPSNEQSGTSQGLSASEMFLRTGRVPEEGALLEDDRSRERKNEKRKEPITIKDILNKAVGSGKFADAKAKFPVFGSFGKRPAAYHSAGDLENSKEEAVTRERKLEAERQALRKEMEGETKGDGILFESNLRDEHRSKKRRSEETASERKRRKGRHDDSDQTSRSKRRHKRRHDESDEQRRRHKRRHDESDDSDELGVRQKGSRRHDDDDDSRRHKRRHDESDEQRRRHKRRHDESDEQRRRHKRRHDESDDNDEQGEGHNRGRHDNDSDRRRRHKGRHDDESGDNKREERHKRRHDDSDGGPRPNASRHRSHDRDELSETSGLLREPERK